MLILILRIYISLVFVIIFVQQTVGTTFNMFVCLSIWHLITKKQQAALPQGIVPFVFAKEYNVHPDILSTG